MARRTNGSLCFAPRSAMPGSSCHDSDGNRSRTCRKQTFGRSSHGRPCRTDVIDQKDTQSAYLWRRFKRLTEFTAKFSAEPRLRIRSYDAKKKIACYGKVKSLCQRAHQFKALIESTFTQAGRMERDWNDDMRKRGRGIMLSTKLGQQFSQRIQSRQAPAEFSFQNKLSQGTFVNSIEEKIVPWRKLLQTLAARNDRRIIHSRRFSAMRAKAGFSSEERSTAGRAEQSLNRWLGRRNKRFTAEGTAAFIQSAKAPQCGYPAPEKHRSHCRRGSFQPMSLHRERPPKIRAA